MSRFHKNIIFLDPWLVWEAQWMLNRLAIFSCCLCTLSVKVLWWDSSRGEGGHHTHLLSAWLTLTASLSRVWCLWWQRQSQGLPGRGGARSWLDSSCRCSRVMSRMAGMWKRRVNRWGSLGAKMLSRAMRQYSLASAASQRSSSLQGKGRGGAELWRSGHRIGWAVGSWRERATSQASLASCSVLQVRYLCFKQNKKPQLVAFFFFLVIPHCMWDLSSLIRDWTRAPAAKALSPNHWTARELLNISSITRHPVYGHDKPPLASCTGRTGRRASW